MPFSANHCIRGHQYYVERVVRSEPAPKLILFGEMPGYYVGNSLAEKLLLEYKNIKDSSLESLLHADVATDNELHQKAQNLGVLSSGKLTTIAGQGGLTPQVQASATDEETTQNGKPLQLPRLPLRHMFERSIPSNRRGVSDVTLPSCLTANNKSDHTMQSRIGRRPLDYTTKLRHAQLLKKYYPPQAITRLEKVPYPIRMYTEQLPHVILDSDLRRQQGRIIDDKMKSLQCANGNPIKLEPKHGYEFDTSRKKRPRLAPLEQLIEHSASLQAQRHAPKVSNWLDGFYCHPKQIHVKIKEEI